MAAALASPGRLAGVRLSPQAMRMHQRLGLNGSRARHPRATLPIASALPATRSLSLWPFSRSSPPAASSSPSQPPSVSASLPPSSPPSAGAPSSSSNPAADLVGSPSAGPASTAAPPTAPVGTPASTQAAQSTVSAPDGAVTSNLPDASSLADSASTLTDSTSILTDATASTVAQAASIAPLQLGDMSALGLTSLWPPGLTVSALELLQVSTGMPWWATIASGSFIIRAALIPLAVRQARTQAAMAPITARIQELREQMNEAARSGDRLAQQRSALLMRKTYSDAGVSVGGMFLPAVIQIPVLMGAFIGVKRICELPVPQLTVGGFGPVMDLTVHDPTYVLPLMFVPIVIAQIKMSTLDMRKTDERQVQMLSMFRFASVLFAGFLAFLPAGLQLAAISGAVAYMGQFFVLHIPKVRHALRLPIIQPHERVNLPPMLESMKSFRADFQHRLAEAQRLDAERRAGVLERDRRAVQVDKISPPKKEQRR